jgi:ubiquinone/menaquinone biosynthesis C-methylase UbiE
MNPAEFANIAKSEQHFWWYRGMREILFGMLDPLVAARPMQRVLDAGCGTGYFAKLVEQRYDIPTYAIDFGRDGVELGRRMGLRRLAQCDVRALPFRDESFDLVLSMDVVAHFPRGGEAPAFREMARVLSRRGVMAIRVSALDILHSRHSQFAHERQRFTRRRIIEATEAAGLRVLRCTYANTLLAPVAFAKFRIWEPLTRQPPTSGVEPVAAWMDHALHGALAIEATLTRAGWNLPIGQSLVLLAEKRV